MTNKRKGIKEIIFDQVMKNPNSFGETIREYAFVKKHEYDFGCYSTFYLKPEFKPVGRSSKLGQKLLNILSENMYQFDMYEYSIEEFLEDYPDTQLYSNGTVHIAWYWDGDGTLLVISGKQAAINDDCKKDHGWKWVK